MLSTSNLSIADVEHHHIEENLRRNARRFICLPQIDRFYISKSIQMHPSIRAFIHAEEDCRIFRVISVTSPAVLLRITFSIFLTS
ncbi:hypothetical protein T10_711 [Trichinella papuae]|uniref:Uncharacterized protein n=1 Tax=Trichinella papuae TaxID=268474 RepID=A0A0V1MWM4_9BILA|nr:hypothetical protein T10_711 [Trichinella papuae]